MLSITEYMNGIVYSEHESTVNYMFMNGIIKSIISSLSLYFESNLLERVNILSIIKDKYTGRN